MKQKLIAAVLLPLALTACQQAAEEPKAEDSTVASAVAGDVQLETDMQIYSYGVGYQIGNQMTTSPMEMDAAAISAGIQDAMGGNAERIPMEKLVEVAGRIQAEMQQKQAEMQAQQQAEAAALAAENAKASADYLAANAKNEDVVVTASGLQYQILEASEGEKPVASDTVVVNYRGTLVDGTEFDSSYKRGTPAEFPVGAVIKGWQEAIQLMPVGSKWKIVIPPELAYGAGGQGPVPGNAALVFEVELLEIKPQTPAE